MLGKDRDREHARVLSGDVDLTADLIDSSRFTKNILLVVCRLPKRIFQKMPKEKSWLIMKNACFQAWQKDQYNITWIEHKDKGRLELNFVILMLS